MIVRSTVTEFNLVWSDDPALDKPSRDRFEDDGAYAAAMAAFADKLRVARDTGNYAPVLRPGSVPTVFTFRPVRGKLLTRLLDARRADGQAIGAIERLGLMVRIGFARVENDGGLVTSLRRDRDPDYPGLGEMAGDDLLTQLNDVHADLLIELGSEVATRSTHPPKP